VASFNTAIKSFTLVELIIVIIIVGILASLGLTQYNLMVEKSRTVEAKVRIGTMRTFAYQYYLEHGTLEGMVNADVGVDNTCTSVDLYRYYVSNYTTYAALAAARCTSGGKAPNTTRLYYFFLLFYPGVGQSEWHCHYSDDSSACFGLPA
jgi:prepilin-type N-terminal cleavage/methylation domain-containing protein